MVKVDYLTVEDMPEARCDYELSIESCRAPLAPYHNGTMASPFSQSVISSMVEVSTDFRLMVFVLP